MRKRRHSAPADSPLVVVGLDPGLANLGLGAIRQEGRNAIYLDSKLVRTHSRTDQSERLAQLYQEVEAFLKRHRPGALAIEGQYFHRQREVAFKVGQAVGVCLLAANHVGTDIVEYGPMQVKQALVGTGRASKAQVTYMVRAMLNIRQAPESHHVSDALALALTHLSSHRISSLI